MTPGDQLKAISRLKLEDGLSPIDHHDIRIWRDRCGKDYDFTVLGEKSIERIRAIFDRFFTVDGA